MKTLHEIIGERLKSLREASGLSQAKLAKLCNWGSQSRIGNYELGARKINADDAIVLSQVLGVSPGELLFGDASNVMPDKQPKLTEEQEEILKIFDGLPRDEADRFLREMKEKKAHFDNIFEEMLKKRQSGV